MLVIRLQRTGRKGHAQFRMIVQDSRRAPSSGRVVENLGSYNPHTKELNIDKDKAATFINNGAQPSDRVARILKAEGVKLPSWVKITETGEKKTKNPEKLRKNQPKEEAPAGDDESTEASTEGDAEAPEEVAAPDAEAKSEDASEATTEQPEDK